MVASCATCQKKRHKNPALPLFPVLLPVHPFQMVSADIFQFARVHYLILVDEYSKLSQLRQRWSHSNKSLQSSALTIEALGGFFTNFVTPEVLLSDNGKQFIVWSSIVFVTTDRFSMWRPVRSFSSQMVSQKGTSKRWKWRCWIFFRTEKRCGRCWLQFGPLQCRISCRIRPCFCKAVISVARSRSCQQLLFQGWSRLRLSSSSYGGRLKHPLVKRAEWMCGLRL